MAAAIYVIINVMVKIGLAI